MKKLQNVQCKKIVFHKVNKVTTKCLGYSESTQKSPFFSLYALSTWQLQNKYLQPNPVFRAINSTCQTCYLRFPVGSRIVICILHVLENNISIFLNLSLSYSSKILTKFLVINSRSISKFIFFPDCICVTNFSPFLCLNSSAGHHHHLHGNSSITYVSFSTYISLKKNHLNGGKNILLESVLHQSITHNPF